MKKIIVNNENIKLTVKQEIAKFGNDCDLNHLDVSGVTNMAFLFENTQFNGDISKWDVKSLVTANHMFHNSQFNGDISKWDVKSLVFAEHMFRSSKFNQDITSWDVSNLVDAKCMFYKSKFQYDLSSWRPKEIKSRDNCFNFAPAPLPYWANSAFSLDSVKHIIERLELGDDLDTILSAKNGSGQKLKI